MKTIKRLVAAMLLTGLSACNDDDSPAPAQDSFTATVSAVVDQSPAVSEAAKPVSVTAVMVDSSETAEPVAVSF
ncbi:MAG TPA: hypothetical protein DF427_03075 [Moraxellaceae bacterium]|nr:hypothetical protein [Moraxellaceae bacterium]